MHLRNKFNHQAKNVENFIQAAYKDSDFVKQVFRPRQLGQFTKINQGIKTNVVVPEREPDFKRIDYTDKGRRISLGKEKPPLAPMPLQPETPETKRSKIPADQTQKDLTPKLQRAGDTSQL